MIDAGRTFRNVNGVSFWMVFRWSNFFSLVVTKNMDNRQNDFSLKRGHAGGSFHFFLNCTWYVHVLACILSLYKYLYINLLIERAIAMLLTFKEFVGQYFILITQNSPCIPCDDSFLKTNRDRAIIHHIVNTAAECIGLFQKLLHMVDALKRWKSSVPNHILPANSVKTWHFSRRTNYRTQIPNVYETRAFVTQNIWNSSRSKLPLSCFTSVIVFIITIIHFWNRKYEANSRKCRRGLWSRIVKP